MTSPSWSAESWPRLAALESGDLQEVPVAALLSALASRGATAVVEFERRQIAKSLVLEHGAPVDVRSNLIHETFGRFLVAEDKLAAAALPACLKEAAERDLPLGEILVERGLLQPVDVFRLLQQNLAKKLLDLFAWSEGTFRVSPEVPVVRSSLRVKVPQLVLTGVSRFAPQAQIDAIAAAIVGERLELHPAPAFEAGDLRLTDAQSKVMQALRAGGRLDELAQASGVSLEELPRAVVALLLLGLALPASAVKRVGVEASPAASAPREPAHQAPSPAPEIGAPRMSAALVEALGNDVTQAFLRYRQQDAFDFFGLPDDATQEAIENRFLELATRWSAERFAAPELGPYAERARDVFLAAARSYGELADSERRGALLFRRKTLREQAARRPAQHAIRTDLLDPEVQFRKGMEHLEAGRLREAIQQFEFASDCDPQSGLYRAELAWARYKLSPGHAERLAGDLEEALRVDPACGMASYYAGILRGELGEFEAAENHLRAASRRLAPDRRPIEALKALAAKRKR